MGVSTWVLQNERDDGRSDIYACGILLKSKLYMHSSLYRSLGTGREVELVEQLLKTLLPEHLAFYVCDRRREGDIGSTIPTLLN